MNPLTQIKNTQKATRAEIELGISDKSSWHARFKHSAYVYVGGLPFELTEGDLLAVFSQYGEVVDVHLVRDKKTGKSKGFAFLAYEDQRSTVLSVDNLSGARVAGRTIRVEHVDNYRKKRAEVEGEPIPEDNDEEGQQQRDELREAEAAAAAAGAEVVHQVSRDGGGSGGGGRGNTDPSGVPWGGGGGGGGGNSMYDILAQAKAEGLTTDQPWKQLAAATGGGGVKKLEGSKDHHRKEKKAKKEKREKKEVKEEKRRHRSVDPRDDSEEERRRRRRRSRSRSRSRSREKGEYNGGGGGGGGGGRERRRSGDGY